MTKHTPRSKRSSKASRTRNESSSRSQETDRRNHKTIARKSSPQSKKKNSRKKTNKKAPTKPNSRRAKRTPTTPGRKVSRKKTSNQHQHEQTLATRKREEITIESIAFAFGPGDDTVATADASNDSIDPNDAFDQCVSRFSIAMLSTLRYINAIERLSTEIAVTQHRRVMQLVSLAIEQSPKAATSQGTPLATLRGKIHGTKPDGSPLILNTTIPIYDQSILEEYIDYTESKNTTRDLLYRTSVQQISNIFEQLMIDLLRTHYLCHPESAPKDRSITYQDLLSFDSIEEAKARVIEAEAERFSATSTEDQFKRIEAHIGSLEKIAPMVPDVVELLLRRHAVVHADGRASREYVRRARPFIKNADKIPAVDTALDIDFDYVMNGWDATMAAGQIIAEKCWRKAIGKSTPEHAEQATNQAGFECLRLEAFNAAKMIFDFCNSETRSDPVLQKMAILNHAIALKSVNCDEYIELVDAELWRVSSADFQLAAAGIREDRDSVAKLLPRAARDNDLLDATALCHWPAFRWIREWPDFDQLVETAFGGLPALRQRIDPLKIER